MKGVINLYKPKGVTCFDCIAKVRKILHERQVGHMGTLDPAGEGVLPIGVGKATRLFDYYLKKDKVYEAEFAFGYETDTLDGDGEVINSSCVLPSQSQIQEKLPLFIGQIEQMPPKYSAKNIGGKRAYDLAREGVEFTLKSAQITIYSIEILGKTAENTYKFSIHCAAGAYIRSLCRDIAYSLGAYATMISIKRLRSGNYKIEDSVTLEELETAKESALIPLERALEDMQKVVMPPEFYSRLANGVKIEYEKIAEPFTLFCNGILLGIASSENGYIKIKTCLRDRDENN